MKITLPNKLWSGYIKDLPAFVSSSLAKSNFKVLGTGCLYTDGDTRVFVEFKYLKDNFVLTLYYYDANMETYHKFSEIKADLLPKPYSTTSKSLKFYHNNNEIVALTDNMIKVLSMDLNTALELSARC